MNEKPEVVTSGQIDFDPAALSSYLTARFGAAMLSLERISGGQSNPTYFVGWGERAMVLCKQSNEPILCGAHGIDREHRVLEVLAATNVPVPVPLLYESEAQILGTPFYFMERLQRVFHDDVLPGMSATERHDIYMAMANVVAKLHAIDPSTVGFAISADPAITSNARLPGGPAQLEQSTGEVVPHLAEIGKWLG